MKNYYEILEVNKKASKEVIEKAYKVLVKKYHPDLNRSSKPEITEQKIQEINEAYEVLSDDFLREQYDKEIEKQTTTQTNNKNNFGKQSSIQTKTIYNKSKKNKVGSLEGIIELVQELYKNKPKREEMKEMTKKDVTALLLTIVVVVLIGVILWFVPFTNAWMRELLFENPIFNWIGRLFSK